jgi:3-oxoacyl-[acyl-carrier protein] reductase
LEAAAARLGAAASVGAERGPERVHACGADIGTAEGVESLLRRALESLGGLDGVVHAAGVLGPIGPTLEVEPAAWWDAVRVNLFGSFLVASAAGRVLRDGGGGGIVLLSGGGAAPPFPHSTSYASGKAGVVRLAESLALELAPYGVRVNSLAPGFVATRIHEATLAAGARAGEEYLRSTEEQLAAGGVPAELAGRAAVFLLSERAAGLTGRLVSAPWDRWWEWPARLSGAGSDSGSGAGGAAASASDDLFRLRRIVPRDRGGDWQ